jgi:ABC-type antimicrobial peptide transport system permease subunit
MESFISKYRAFMLWGIPVGFVIGLTVGFYHGGNIQDLSTKALSDPSFWKFIAVLAVLTFLMFGVAYLYTKTVMKRIYTRYYLELKGCQQDLLDMEKEINVD